jgi:cobalt-zinc-cadmium efflux system membrane fusion protein
MLLAAAAITSGGCGGAPDERNAEHGHDEHGAHDEPADTQRFGPRDMQRFGVTLAEAGPGPVDVAIELPGEVRPNADRLAHLAPRFAGIVRAVHKRVGDSVRAGEALAVIESETLARYELRAAFDGTVIDRHVTAGEVVRPDTPAFIVADLATVWIEVAVYQKDLPLVGVGRKVYVDGGPGIAGAEGTVAAVAPIVDQATRTAVARVVLENPDGRWRPGMFVTAVVLDPTPAPLIVPKSALHADGGRTVVFVAEGERFEMRPVVLGRVGRTAAEITTGLAAGERVAADGSFLVKAELAKGEAGHAH